MADELFDLRNTVALGNFHQAIAEGSQIRVSGRQADEIVDIHAERDLLVARAQVGLGQWDAVIADQRNASHPTLKCALAWATFVRALRSASNNNNNSKQIKKDEPEVASALKILESVAGDTPKVGVAATAATMLAACYFHLASADDENASSSLNAGLHLCGSWVAALSKQIPQTAPPSNTLVRHLLELRAVCVEGLLRLARLDLADRMLQEMRTLDDDAVITMLAGVSVTLAQAAQIGGAPLNSASGDQSQQHDSKANEALSIIQDLSARCGQSTTLLNIAAIASLLAGKSTDSEGFLVASLGKRSTDVDTLSNLAALAANLSKPVESYNRLVGQAASSDSNGAWTKQYAAAQLRFREAASSFAAAQ